MMSEEMKNQQIEMLIRFYNMQAGTAFRVGKQENREAVSGAIDRADGDNGEEYLKEVFTKCEKNIKA